MREFKTKEEALSFFRHFYDDAFDNENTEDVILKKKKYDKYEIMLKIKTIGEPYYRVYGFSDKLNYDGIKAVFSYIVSFWLETLDGKTISDQYEADNMRNYFSVFDNYEVKK